MKISQNTIDRIKSYILKTQSNSTYNSSPHEPLELCFYKDNWNLCNCYKYINRYLSTNGEKSRNVKDLLKACHYAWLEYNKMITTDFDSFKEEINNVNTFNTSMFNPKEISSDLINLFEIDDLQVRSLLWMESQYYRISVLLIELHETKDLDPT